MFSFSIETISLKELNINEADSKARFAKHAWDWHSSFMLEAKTQQRKEPHGCHNPNEPHLHRVLHPCPGSYFTLIPLILICALELNTHQNETSNCVRN